MDQQVVPLIVHLSNTHSEALVGPQKAGLSPQFEHLEQKGGTPQNPAETWIINQP